ncbi:MAG TPA: hypothetical protein VF571_09320 [Pyrinomonadaceae bacterium]|jgi:hypothetical protein
MQINERFIQFAFINSKGNINKTALKLPFETDLQVDQDVDVNIEGYYYRFTCVAEETKTNNDGTVDKIYVISTIAA